MTCRTVTTDNFFTSFSLALKLRSENTSLLGTIRANKKELPKTCKLKKYGMRKPNIKVIIQSTKHKKVTIDKIAKKLPETVSFYNKTKFSVDVTDEMARKYTVKSRSKRWPLQNRHDFNTNITVTTTNTSNNHHVRPLNEILEYLKIMDGSIRIAVWNSNGLRQRLQELKIFIYTHNIDIMAISDTHFTEHIEDVVDLITKIIQEPAWLSSSNIQENKKSCSYPANVLLKIKQKRKVQYKWQRYKTEENKRQLNALSREVKIMIKECCNSGFNNYLLNLTPNEDTNYSLWKATKKLKRPITQIPALRKPNGSSAKTFVSMEQAKTFTNHLYQNFREIVWPRQDHQFGYREKHATTEQVHRLINQITPATENKKYCASLFLDVGKAFDKVWHECLLKTIRQYLQVPIYLLLKSYLNNRTYYVKVKDSHSAVHVIFAGVPLGSVLGPVLYTLYTSIR
ncbi:uncharacterized protein LOC124428615 [Vespa crabro]|uniref:uncharacterized protein LOC124428615 n=1 Tax=Vespa crabro TaxID=7445 RepID=UPI001F0283CE|nr:uncharacterized protein LOC124428615 [Vespa crabro]